MTSTKKISFKDKKTITKQLLTSISVDIRIYLPLSDINIGLAASVNVTFFG